MQDENYILLGSILVHVDDIILGGIVKGCEYVNVPILMPDGHVNWILVKESIEEVILRVRRKQDEKEECKEKRTDAEG
jgi:hypothetical protein